VLRLSSSNPLISMPAMHVQTIPLSKPIAAAPAFGTALVKAHASECAVMLVARMAAAAGFLVVDAQYVAVRPNSHFLAFWSSETSLIDRIIFCQAGAEEGMPPDSRRKYAIHSRNSG
jgi:hypothetical protein